MKTNSIKLAFYDSQVGKVNFRNTAVFHSCFSFSLPPPCAHAFMTSTKNYQFCDPPLPPSAKINNRCIV